VRVECVCVACANARVETGRAHEWMAGAGWGCVCVEKGGMGCGVGVRGGRGEGKGGRAGCEPTECMEGPGRGVDAGAKHSRQAPTGVIRGGDGEVQRGHGIRHTLGVLLAAHLQHLSRNVRQSVGVQFHLSCALQRHREPRRNEGKTQGLPSRFVHRGHAVGGGGSTETTATHTHQPR
jgi:hypothetical protein